jgi:hypothetical protein
VFAMRQPEMSSERSILSAHLELTLRTAALLFFFFLVFYVLWFSPAWLDGRSLAPGDGLAFYRPNYQPPTLWEPNLMTGFPVSADPQVMTWYPLSLLLSWIPGTWNLFVISAYAIGSWFTCLYVLTLTENRVAGLVSGIVYGLSGFLVMHLPHVSVIHAAAWVPGILLAAESLRIRPRASWIAAGAGATACCILAGHTQIVVYGLSLAGIYILVMGFSRPDRWKYYFSAYGFMVLGIGLSAIQLLPAAELSRLTGRSNPTFAFFTTFSLSWTNLLTLLFPYLLGGPGLPGFLGDTYFGPWNTFEMAGYVGFAAPVLAAIAVIVRRRQSVVLFWLIAGLCALLLAMGGATPLGKLLFHIPVFNLFRVQARFLLVFDLAIAVLAGLGLHTVTKHPELYEGLARISQLMLAGLFVLALAITLVFGPELKTMAATKGIMLSLQPWENVTLGLPLLSGMAITSLLGFLLRTPKSRAAQICFLLGVTAEMGIAACFLGWQAASPRASDLEISAALAKDRDALQRMSGRWLPIEGIPGRPTEAPPDLSRLWGIPNVSKYGPLLPSRVHDMLTLESQGAISGKWEDGADRAFDIVGARYIVLPPDSAQQPEKLDGLNAGRWRFVENLGGSRVVENLRAMPRTWLVAETIPLPPDQLVQAIHTSQLPDGRTYDPVSMALIEEQRPFRAGGSGTAEIAAATNTRIQIVTHTDQPAFLVLADFDYPGWQCAVDGEAAHIFSTNYIQRGVFVPAGNSTIEFRYRPASLYRGAGVSLAALLLLAFIWYRGR